MNDVSLDRMRARLERHDFDRKCSLAPCEPRGWEDEVLSQLRTPRCAQGENFLESRG